MTNEPVDLTSSGMAPRPLEVSTSTTFADLVVQLGAKISNPDDLHRPIVGVSLDSRKVRAGDLFVALPGVNTHGAVFGDQAAQSGAIGILTDQDGLARLTQQGVGLPILTVPNVRHAMAIASAAIYGQPAQQLRMLGVTGTNGKTTTTLMIEHALLSAGAQIGTIGTIGTRLNGAPVPNEISTVTTPESPQLQELLARYVAADGQWVAMEVSSHALALERVTGIVFDVAGFTNLGQDHLDFHHTVANYFEAKAKLFTSRMTRSAAINIDDPAGQELHRRVSRAGLPLLTTGCTEQADVQIVAWTPNSAGCAVRIRLQQQVLDFQLGMPGEFNVRNAATTLAMLTLADFDVSGLLDSFAQLRVPGRMEPVMLAEVADRRAPQVFVDFGHTPQAITAALRAAEGSAGRLIAVFGAGGDRDPAKRAPMGAAATELADVIIITDDNPRSEDPASIREQIVAGWRDHPRASEVEIINGGDRRSAIRIALQMAEPDDRIVILGKGHEKTQEIAGLRHPFDDVVVAQELWSSLGEGA